LPEWRVCYAYTPAHPDVYELNVTAWLIVEMCDGQTLADLESAFLKTLHRNTLPDEGRALLHVGLKTLVERDIIICRPGMSATPTELARREP
jgi:hypothetical protein